MRVGQRPELSLSLSLASSLHPYADKPLPTTIRSENWQLFISEDVEAFHFAADATHHFGRSAAFRRSVSDRNVKDRLRIATQCGPHLILRSQTTSWSPPSEPLSWFTGMNLVRLQPTPSFQSHGTGKLLTHKLQVSCPWQGAAEVLSKSSDQKRARIRSSLGHAARSLRSPRNHICLLGDSISQHTAFESTCLLNHAGLQPSHGSVLL